MLRNPRMMLGISILSLSGLGLFGACGDGESPNCASDVAFAIVSPVEAAQFGDEDDEDPTTPGLQISVALSTSIRVQVGDDPVLTIYYSDSTMDQMTAGFSSDGRIRFDDVTLKNGENRIEVGMTYRVRPNRTFCDIYSAEVMVNATTSSN